MGVVLSYDLTGSGWARCTLRVDYASVTVRASYLSDALQDFAQAVAAILRGEPEATASFADEPGEYRWTFEPLPGGYVRIRVAQYIGLWGKEPQEEWEPIFFAECPLRDFAAALVSELERLERTHGLSGYREKWVMHDFPAKQLAELRDLLKNSG